MVNFGRLVFAWLNLCFIIASIKALECDEAYAEIASSDHSITLADLQDRRPLGSKAKHPLEYATYKSCPVAVKCGNPLLAILLPMQTDVSEEYELMLRLQSRFIAVVYGMIERCMIMKLYPFDAENMPNKKRLPLEKKLRYALQIAQGIDFAMKQNVTEFSIKPQNVLYDEDEDKFVLTDLERSAGPLVFQPPFGLSPTFAFSYILQSLFRVSVDAMKHKFLFHHLFGRWRRHRKKKAAFASRYMPSSEIRSYALSRTPHKARLPNAPAEVQYLHSQCRQLVLEARPTIPEVIVLLEKLIAGERISPSSSDLKIKTGQLDTFISTQYSEQVLNHPKIPFADIRMVEFVGEINGFPVFSGYLLNKHVFLCKMDVGAERLSSVLGQEMSIYTYKRKRFQVKTIGIAEKIVESNTKYFAVLKRS